MKPSMEQLLSINIWKERRTMQDVMNSEFSYSLLFNNILPSKLDDALQLVGLSTLPNFFFIAHVNDYSNQTMGLAQVNEWRQKNNVFASLKQCVRESGFEGFCANMPSTENVIGYICLPENMPEEDAQDAMIDFAKNCQKKVRQKTYFTVSMYISSYIKTIEDIQRDYEIIYRELQKRLFSGREQLVRVFELNNDELKIPKAEININKWFLKICAAIGENNSTLRLSEISIDFMNEILKINASPERNRSGLIKLINAIEEYCLNHDVAPSAIFKETQTIIDVILKYNFILDIQLPLWTYLCHVAKQIQKKAVVSNYSFKAPVQEFIKLNYAGKIHIADAARLFHLSKDHFSRLFKKNFGMTFQEYLLHYRLDMAVERLLEDGVGIDQIALECGFNSTSYFCSSFKKKHGVTPSQYRKANTLLSRQ